MKNKKVLLHICCAICAIYPIKYLRDEGFSVEGLFFNPNIQPHNELVQRRQAVAQLASVLDIPVHYPNLSPQSLPKTLPGGQGKRCNDCWHLRLNETAKWANIFGNDFFTTTLLVSPYQDNDRLKEIGGNVSKERGINFLYQDFRPGFKGAVAEAKRLGLYSQKYCGCFFSKSEALGKNKT